MMAYLMFALSVIGGCVVGVLALEIAKETVRAARQGAKIATVAARLQGRRKMYARDWLRAACREFYDCGYDQKLIGPYCLDRDPSVRAKKAW